MSESNSTWNCQLVPDPQMTVGTLLNMTCRGEPTSFKKQLLKIHLSKDEEYALQLTNVVNLTSEEAQLIVTSYLPGQHELKSALLTDGETHVRLQLNPFHVRSVLKPGVKSEPYPSFGPLKLSLPTSYWIGSVLLLTLVTTLLVFRIRKNLQRRKMLEELLSHETALPPFHQFNKDIRLLSRGLTHPTMSDESPDLPQFMSHLDEAFRLYLVRELRVPAQQWSNKAILKEIRKRESALFKQAGDQLKIMFRELEKAQRDTRNVTELDCEQLSKMCRDTVELIWQTRRGSVT